MHKVHANGAEIPALGFGTWTLRGKQCTELVVEALAAGYRHIDTATMYGNEAAVGAELKASGVAAADTFITTKVWRTDLAPADLIRSAEESRARLGVDRIDLLLIHWPNDQIPLKPSITALNEVHRRGVAGAIGVANFPTGLLAQASAASAVPLACDQVEYHPYLDQRKVLAACRTAGMALVSYCPLYRGGRLFGEPAVTGPAERLGKSPAQIVLRWQVQQAGVVAIPRTTKKARLAENLAVFDFALSEPEMAAISALGRNNSRLVDYDFTPGWD